MTTPNFQTSSPLRYWFPLESNTEMTFGHRARTQLIWMATLILVAIIMCFGALFATIGRVLFEHPTLAGSLLLLSTVSFVGTLGMQLVRKVPYLQKKKSVVDTIPSLGALPNLPERLSDPQQAEIAANAVHQIRMLLQLHEANDEPKAYCVTSPSSGDGKTSFALALGLSFSACGARTLLIDCDLAGAGLSQRLNVSSPDGILEAVAHRALLEYVRTTDIADVAILPVGTTHAHQASTLSPVALRRLIAEAKRSFDRVIIDTGPILGSIEAGPVSAAADSVIMIADKKQKKLLVEKSIEFLNRIGGKVTGIVVNRVGDREYTRSLRGLAMLSRSGVKQGLDYGPVAKAVTGLFKRANSKALVDGKSASSGD